MSEHTINEKLLLRDNIKFFFLNPKIIFKKLSKSFSYGIILLILISTKIINTIVSVSLPKNVINKTIESQTRGIDPQSAEIVKKFIYIINQPSIQIFLSVAAVVVTIFSVSFIIFLILKASKCSLKYNKVVSIYCLASLPIAIHNIVQAVYMFISQKPIIHPNSAIHTTAAAVIYNSINIFSIWQYILLGIGICSVSKISKWKAIIITLICFIFFEGIAIGTGLTKVS